MARQSKTVQKRLKATFVALIIKSVFRVFKSGVIFVNCIVGQVDEHVLDIGLIEAA